MSCCNLPGLVAKFGRAGKLLLTEGIGDRRKKEWGREPRGWVERWESWVGKR